MAYRYDHGLRSTRVPSARAIPKLAAAALLALIAFSSQAAPPVPTDSVDLCSLSPASFASWFQSGAVSLNGVVNPADSRQDLDPQADCSFYRWAAQMFLWLTSPAPPTYGGGAHIFDSPTFYDVSPPDAAGKRTLLKHAPGVILRMGLRVAQLGSQGLPVVIDGTGRLLQVTSAGPDVRPLVRNVAGQTVEIVG